jgi:hypothetical protein
MKAQAWSPRGAAASASKKAKECYGRDRAVTAAFAACAAPASWDESDPIGDGSRICGRLTISI